MLPFTTTTITIRRPTTAGGPADQGGMRDPYDEAEQVPPGDDAEPVVVIAGVGAVIGAPSGTSTRNGATVERGTRQLDADPCDLRGEDLVTDDLTGDEYRVEWRQVRTDTDGEVDHVEAGLLIVRSGA